MTAPTAKSAANKIFCVMCKNTTIECNKIYNITILEERQNNTKRIYKFNVERCKIDKSNKQEKQEENSKNSKNSYMHKITRCRNKC